jgi:glutamate--cysteine ligase
LISSFFTKADNIDFKSSKNLHSLQQKIENILQQISTKYQQYEIKEKPYCYIKADNGTYGMGIIQIYEAEEVLSLNKKSRNKMNIIKDKTKNTSVIIQEGIRTVDRFCDSPAEYMSYCINGQVAANIARFNQGRNYENSLNSQGMRFAEVEKGFFLKDVTDIISQISCIACAKEEI